MSLSCVFCLEYNSLHNHFSSSCPAKHCPWLCCLVVFDPDNFVLLSYRGGYNSNTGSLVCVIASINLLRPWVLPMIRVVHTLPLQTLIEYCSITGLLVTCNHTPSLMWSYVFPLEDKSHCPFRTCTDEHIVNNSLINCVFYFYCRK